MQELEVEGLRARAVNVPMKRPLETSGGAVTSAPLVLIDLKTVEGPTGRSYIFGYTPLSLAPLVALVETLGSLIAGDTLAPVDIEAKLQARHKLIGTPGLLGLAIAGVDMAAWDALAREAEVPLARLLGGQPRPVQTYNSKGLGLMGPERVAEQARELVDEGYGAIKVRLGYETAREDLEVLDAVRAAVGDEIRLMTDYNQGLDVPEAERRADALVDQDLVWIEEPTRFDDYEGHARIRLASALPIQLGENCYGPNDMAKALEAEACDFFMPDAGKIGGVTGWQRAAGLAAPRGMPLSSHLYPEVSLQLMTVTPNAHWLESVDWAEPILASGAVTVEDGFAQPSEAPGIGLEWDEAAVAKYQIG